MFDKRADSFPIKKRFVCLSHCGVSPLYRRAFEREQEIARGQLETSSLIMREYARILDELRAAAAKLLDTTPENVAFVKNTSEAMCMVANGYPFEKGDEIISYVHEYPANHYPWRLAARAGVELKLLPDRKSREATSDHKPTRWTMEDLEKLTTRRTKLVALSHVQFTSGFAADLQELGEFCRANNIDLVIDAAQSLGCLPVYPENVHISALAASGWKWLLGPVGSGIFYTSESFREKLEPVMVGAEMMVQGTDYLNHNWQPHRSAKRFEYSTSAPSLAAAMTACIHEIFLHYGIEAIQREIFRLQDLILEELDRDRYRPVKFPQIHRSGILSVECKEDPLQIVHAAVKEGVICSSRGGYLRLAPHFYNSDDEVLRAVGILNSLSL